MKKIISTLLLLTLTVLCLGVFTGCKNDENDGKIRIGYLTGPTGMGMAKLIHDNGGTEGNDKYSFEKFTQPAKAKDALASGQIDMICYPTNEAVTYLSTVDSNVVVLAVNTLSSLFLLTDENNTINSFSELEGKTIYTCKAGTPRLVLEWLLDAYDINATVSYTVDNVEMLSPENLKDKIIEGAVDIALAPEPVVTAATLNNNDYSIDLGLGEIWDSKVGAPMTMGCIIANKSFVENNKNAVNNFLSEYKSSIEYISNEENADTSAAYITEAGIMDKAPAAKKALLNLGDAIAYLDEDDMKNALIAFYQAMNIQLPNDEFYYKK